VTSEETQAVLDQEHLRLLVPQQARGNVNDAFAQQSMQMMFALFGIVCAIGVTYGIVEIVAGDSSVNGAYASSRSSRPCRA